MRHFSLRPRCPQYAHVLRNEVRAQLRLNPASSNCGRVHHWGDPHCLGWLRTAPDDRSSPRKTHAHARACRDVRREGDCSLVCIDNASHDGEAQSCPARDRLGSACQKRSKARAASSGSCRDLSPSLRALHCPRVRRRGPSLERRSTCGESHC